MITNESDDYPAATIELGGVLDHHSYLSLINMVRELYKRGHRNLIIDMQNVQIIGLKGIFALYSGAMLFNVEQPLEPTGGLKALHMMANRVSDYPTHHITLLSPAPFVKEMLYESGVPIYDDLEAALKSFAHERSLA
jgi:hypothetical protein